MNRVIFHIDVNSAFLSWEAVYRICHLGGTLDLRMIPSAVGGDAAKRHGIILAKSIPAKAYGIRTGESLMEARRKCPEIRIVPPNYNLYENSSRAFVDILKGYSPDVEQYSIDECFVEMTGTSLLWGEPVEVADRIREQIREELGFTVNVGISSNKLLAKMASDFNGPNKTHTLFPCEIEQKMWPLPVPDLFFVGRATAKKLITLGINTIGELAKADPELLKVHLKKHGEVIWAFANGIDISVVEPDPPGNKGYGNSTTIAFDVADSGTAKMVLLALSETVGARLRKDHVKAEVISVGIKDYEFRYASHQRVLGASTDITKEIHGVACRLFDELWNGTPIRHLGVHTGRIKEKDCFRQIDMFDTTNYEKLEKADEAIDMIRERHGIDAVKRATFLIGEGTVDHMSGGITRDKRSADYSKERIE